MENLIGKKGSEAPTKLTPLTTDDFLFCLEKQEDGSYIFKKVKNSLLETLDYMGIYDISGMGFSEIDPIPSNATKFNAIGNVLSIDFDFADYPNLKWFDIGSPNSATAPTFTGLFSLTKLIHFGIDGNYQSEEQINAILAELVLLQAAHPELTPAVTMVGNTAPSGQGITDRDFLNANGWSVTTD